MRQVLARIRTDFGQHVEPWRLGAAVAVGLTIGLTPLFGLHLLICVALAHVLRLNKVAVYAAANISVPVMIPFIAVACIQVGYYIVHRHWLDLAHLSVDELRFTFPLYWLGGASLIGIVCGIPLALLVTMIAQSWRKAAAAVPGEQLRLYEAFLPDGRVGAKILQGKVRHDVVYRVVLEQLSEAQSVLDVGGGKGALPLLLGLKSSRLASAVVLDWDRQKLVRGASAARRLRLPVAYQESDAFSLATSWPAATFEAITCIDLLHYADLDKQRLLVGRMVTALAPGGRLLIRDMDKDLGFRTFLTLAQEQFSLALRLTRAGKLVPRSGRDLARQLEDLGLSVAAQRCHGSMPFSNTLWIATKPGAMLP